MLLLLWNNDLLKLVTTNCVRQTPGLGSTAKHERQVFENTPEALIYILWPLNPEKAEGHVVTTSQSFCPTAQRQTVSPGSGVFSHLSIDQWILTTWELLQSRHRRLSWEVGYFLTYLVCYQWDWIHSWWQLNQKHNPVSSWPSEEISGPFCTG